MTMPAQDGPTGDGAAGGRDRGRDAAARSAEGGTTGRRSGGARAATPRVGAAPEVRARVAGREYDPRREQRRRASRLELPEQVDARELDAEVRRDLRSLSSETAELVAQHLVVVGRLIDDEPERALEHAQAAGALAGRVAAVREATGLAAYAADQWKLALAELRAARRISGRAEHLAVMADCERGLGRPGRALEMSQDPDAGTLGEPAKVELLIVLAGARCDLGQVEAAVLLLREPAERSRRTSPWALRLWYAYADTLLTAGQLAAARQWFARAAELDAAGETDVADRLLALDGVSWDEPVDGVDEP